MRVPPVESVLAVKTKLQQLEVKHFWEFESVLTTNFYCLKVSYRIRPNLLPYIADMNLDRDREINKLLLNIMFINKNSSYFALHQFCSSINGLSHLLFVRLYVI